MCLGGGRGREGEGGDSFMTKVNLGYLSMVQSAMCLHWAVCVFLYRRRSRSVFRSSVSPLKRGSAALIRSRVSKTILKVVSPSSV